LEGQARRCGEAQSPDIRQNLLKIGARDMAHGSICSQEAQLPVLRPHRPSFPSHSARGSAFPRQEVSGSCQRVARGAAVFAVQ